MLSAAASQKALSRTTNIIVQTNHRAGLRARDLTEAAKNIRYLHSNTVYLYPIAVITTEISVHNDFLPLFFITSFQFQAMVFWGLDLGIGGI